MALRSTNSLFLIYTLALAFFSASVLNAQTESEESDDEFVFPTAQEVIDKYVRAVGGYELLGSRENIHYISNGYSSHGSVFVYEVYQAEGLFSARFNYEDGSVIERGIRTDKTLNEDGSRAGHAWEISRGSFREMIGDERQEYIRRRSSVTAVARLFEYYQSIEFDSTDAIDGREINALVFTDHNGKEIKRYYDAETGLLRRQICDESLSNRNMSVVRDYLNYERVGDYMISKKQVVTQSSGSVWTYEIELYEVDARIPKGTFDLPMSIKQSIAQAEAEKQAATEAIAAAAKAKLLIQNDELTESDQKTVAASVDKQP